MPSTTRGTLAGALAAGANEALVEHLAALVDIDSEEGRALLGLASQLVGALSSGLTGGDASLAGDIAGHDTAYNYLSHTQMEGLAVALAQCEANGNCSEIAQAYFEHHQINQQALLQACDGTNTAACQAIAREVYEAVLNWQRFAAVPENWTVG